MFLFKASGCSFYKLSDSANSKTVYLTNLYRKSSLTKQICWRVEGLRKKESACQKSTESATIYQTPRVFIQVKLLHEVRLMGKCFFLFHEVKPESTLEFAKFFFPALKLLITCPKITRCFMSNMEKFLPSKTKNLFLFCHC